MIRIIDKWSRSPGDRHLSLLDGPAGFGKSAIARTVAERWDRSKRLAGTFFFFRNSGDQSKVVRLVSTLAYDLTRYLPGTTQLIEDALIEDARLLNRPIEHQFQKLIVDPVAALPEQSHRQIIVIDALDECEDRESIRQLIEFITRIDYSKFPIDILFTSRREEHIRRIFESSPFSRMIYQISLSNTAFNVHGDIKRFLRSQFRIIYQGNPRLMENIPSPWPSRSDLNEIVRKVNGSFIFAFTLTRYISEGREPPQRLKLIVERHNGVDGMYREIVEQFWGHEHFPIVFSTIMLLRRPLSVIGLASLLDLTIPDILTEIFKIQSILVIPADNKTPVDVVHTSLRDFSVSKERSGAIFVNTSRNQLITAERCLKVMSTQSGVVVLEGEAAIYAYRHWHGHLLLTLEDPDYIDLQRDLLAALNFFVAQSFKIWFNTIIFNSGYDEIYAALTNIIQKAMVSLCSSQTITLLLISFKKKRQENRDFPRKYVKNLKHIQKNMKVRDSLTKSDACLLLILVGKHHHDTTKLDRFYK